MQIDDIVGAAATGSTDAPYEFFAVMRGEDSNGSMQAEWKRIHGPAYTADMAKLECQLMLESGLLWNDATVEFRIVDKDGFAMFDARPPHDGQLQWHATEASAAAAAHQIH